MLAKGRIFSMDFWILKGFTYKNMKIERYGTFDDYKKARERIRRKRKHVQTGVLTVEIPDEMKDSVEEYVKPPADNLWMLLSFAHSHDVPIQGFWFFDIENGEEIPKGYSIPAMRTGRPGGGSCLNLQHGLDKFIQKAMPLLEDKAFLSQTNIKHAISWYNEAQNTNLVEFKFMSLWIGVEGLANTYDRRNPGDPLLEKAEWNQIKRIIADFLKGLDNEETIPTVLQRFKFLRERQIEDKICRLLEKHGLDEYCGEIARLNRMRNTILHARHLDLHSKPSPFVLEHRLKRLLEKIIFKALDFYDNDMIYHSIKDDDLDRR